MAALSAGLTVIAAGIALRQADRWWFRPGRDRLSPSSLAAVMSLQRRRLNDVTPALLILGQWLELAGWCLVAAHSGLLGCVLAALAGAVAFRRLQEISHFAVHGVLARGGRVNTLLAEVGAHLPLGFVPVPVRRRRHVREHHPNATVAGADPNLAELRRAGLRPGVTGVRYVLGVLHPLTPAGLSSTVRGLGALVREPGSGRLRALGPVAVTTTLALLLDWETTVFVYVVPRLLLYPQLAWMSLLVEHRWFDPDAVTGPPVVVEAGRCLRLYPGNRPLALLARATWLPYGDLYHFAHSAHPAVRWNYLPALERSLNGPDYRTDALVLGRSAVLRRHRRALAQKPASRIPVQAEPDPSPRHMGGKRPGTPARLRSRPSSSTAPAGYSGRVTPRRTP
ncbi:fatty acid desaturase [Streptomyces sp. AK04-3B]|uniref:fatty acid desaturase n=1 Tax=Streptomyces sp. AK04-3B TaxID=3028650 RepID=UPI0029AC8D24|nr:fatty acid desaturase [Streptomyces sp. AK04-3B]MDX3797175.1 fatty acid desaturase [Streptomyces sp. AK04-3B]